MATHTITQITDDIDGTVIEDGETIRFSFDKTNYEIDLTVENAAAFRAALAPYLNAARRDGSYRQASAPKRSNVTNMTTREQRAQQRRVRDWARDNGYTVGDYGKLPQSVADAFEEAMASKTASA